MATFYADISLGGTGGAGTIGDPYKSSADLVANVSAGNTYLVKNTETLGATATFPNVASAGSPIILRGVNSSWVDDGTKFVLDANSTSSGCWSLPQFYQVENFEAKNSTSNCMLGTGLGVRFQNGLISSAGGNAVNFSGQQSTITNVKMLNAASNGMNATLINSARYSFASGCGGYAFLTVNIVSYCIVHNCGNGIRSNSPALYTNNIVNDCSIAFFALGPGIEISNNCVTSNTTGMNSGQYTIYGNNFQWNNGTYNNLSTEYNHTADIAGTGDPYADESTQDFTLSADGEAGNIAIKIGDLSEANTGYLTAGIPPQYSTTAAPTFAGITGFEIIMGVGFRVSWAAGSGTITGYRIYMRADNSSVFTSPYLVMTANSDATSAIICVDADGEFFDDNVTWHAGVRAVNGSTEETNSVTLNNPGVRPASPLILPIYPVNT